MGVSPLFQRGAVRVSLGWETTAADVERFLGAWRKVSTALSKSSKEQRGMAAEPVARITDVRASLGPQGIGGAWVG
jgi:hypothetical protein